MKINFKENKAITLVALIITIIVIIALASIIIYNGIGTVKASKFTAFTTEFKIMQTQVNRLYDQYSNGNVEVLNFGEEITENSQAKVALNAASIPKEEYIDYRYFNIQVIKDLGIEGIKENEFIVNIKKRKVISYIGLEYDGIMYYTLDQIPNSLYNVENRVYGNIQFDIEAIVEENNVGQIYIKDITSDAYINKWQVFYKLSSEEKWKSTKVFTESEYKLKVDKLGEYDIKICAGGNIFSQIKKVTLK